MRTLHLIITGLFFLCFSLKAEERVYERVFIHTDNDCYVAGEDIWLKFYVVTDKFLPSSLSKVGYVEISDTEKPRMQLKVALEEGRGAGKIRIPADIPSGIYRLTAYTRYMRNEGKKVFFESRIAIVNVGLPSIAAAKRFETVENFDKPSAFEEERSYKDQSIIAGIKTDRSAYGNRQKVVLSLNNIPDNTADLVISVTRNDSIVSLPELNRGAWLKQVRDTFPFSDHLLPEYEGHIITARFVPAPSEQLRASLAFVGNDIRYFNGKVNPDDGTISFYTAGIFGKQQIVTSALSLLYDNAPNRVDLISPFDESLPDSLPVLQIRPNEKRLMERYIATQIRDKTDNDSLAESGASSGYCTFDPVLTYDLDQYTRFETISETILEFVNRVRVSKVGGNRRIKVFMKELQAFNQGNTLVLLDGIPVYDHDAVLDYNPMYIKRINIYDENYLFGGEHFECIVSFITQTGNLPFFQLSQGAQLFNYDCPRLPPPFESPDYSTDFIKNSRKPDFRHTLYWNPFVESTNNRPANLSFYTSDLCGEYKITVEGITADGKMIRGRSYFQVTCDK